MSFWSKKKCNFQEELEQFVEEPPLEQRVELLEIEVASLKVLLRESEKKVSLLENILRKIDGEDVFNKLSDNEKIYRAFDQGENITEIAKKCNKGKGEIELILNLRNLK